MGDKICDDKTYSSLLKELLKGKNISKEKLGGEVDKKLGGKAGDYYYLPHLTEEGSGTEKLLHMTYVF